MIIEAVHEQQILLCHIQEFLYPVCRDNMGKLYWLAKEHNVLYHKSSHRINVDNIQQHKQNHRYLIDGQETCFTFLIFTNFRRSWCNQDKQLKSAPSWCREGTQGLSWEHGWGWLQWSILSEGQVLHQRSTTRSGIKKNTLQSLISWLSILFWMEFFCIWPGGKIESDKKCIFATLSEELIVFEDTTGAEDAATQTGLPVWEPLDGNHPIPVNHRVRMRCCLQSWGAMDGHKKMKQ